MYTISITIALILVALIIGQALLAAGFVSRLRQPPAPPLSDDQCPKVALIICIRGKDATLSECLSAALNQDYPDYGVHIVVDSRSDPAWPLVTRLVAANPGTRATVQLLENPQPTCSLKCSSLIQAITNLEPAYEVVALVDSDVIPHSRWLKDLMAPLTDPQIGATTGLRWSDPSPASLVNLTSHAWNAAAVVLMYQLRVASGCALAIKRSVIHEGHLLEDWANAYGEDTSINPALDKLGLRLEVAPSAMLSHRQDSDFAGLKDWITRQLFSCRLHHQGWWYVVTHAISTSLTLGLAFVVLSAGIFGQRWAEIAPIAGALAAYFVTMMGLLIWLDASVTKASTLQNSSEMHLATRHSWKVLISIVFAQLIYLVSLLDAAFARRIKWRGVKYRLNSSGELRLEKNQISRSGPKSSRSRQHPGVAGT